MKGAKRDWLWRLRAMDRKEFVGICFAALLLVIAVAWLAFPFYRDRFFGPDCTRFSAVEHLCGFGD